jgi:uncharacterized membrane protein (UPF0127 family)
MPSPGHRRSSAQLLLALAFVAGNVACSGRDGDHGGSSSTRGTERRGHRGSEGGSAETSGSPRETSGSHREGAASAPEEPVSQSRVVLEPPGAEPVTVNVEVARTPAETQRGLMYRRHMDPNAGMIFLFSRSRHLTFWMHNTYIPLDMIFITSGMRVLGVVENATPETDDPREVPGEGQFVLEVNAGFAREHGITAGTVVRFEGIDDVPVAAPGGDDDETDEAWEDDE